MITRLAFRNILRQKRRTFFTIAAMVVGFSLAAIGIGWQDGSYSHIIDVFTRAYLGHIQVHYGDYLDRPTLYKNIEDYHHVGDIILDIEGVEAWAPRVISPGLGSVDDKTAPIQVIGIDPELESIATSFDGKVKVGRSMSTKISDEIVIGANLANRLSAGLGDGLIIVSQAADGSIANDLFTIVGIAESGDEMSDRTGIYMHIEKAQELFALDGRAHELIVIVEDIKQISRIAGQIESRLGDPSLEVLPWWEVNKAFYDAMQADKAGADVFYFVLMLIVAVGVLNTVLMAVLERTREFGVLKALGTRPSAVFRMIVTEVFFMAIISIAIGQIIGIAGNYVLSIRGIYMGFEVDVAGVPFHTMYGEVNLKSIVAPTLLVLFSSLFVGMFPAIKAARTVPAKTMRFH